MPVNTFGVQWHDSCWFTWCSESDQLCVGKYFRPAVARPVLVQIVFRKVLKRRIVMAEQSQGKQEFRCKQCGAVLRSQGELQEHQKTHQGQHQGGAPGSTHEAGGGH